jgi:Holliday junction DNA helicase RuvB
MGLSPFTLVGATTDWGMLPAPLRDRVGQSFYLQLYTLDELKVVTMRVVNKMEYLTDDAALTGIAQRSRGTPRVALRLLRRCVDAAVGLQTDIIDGSLVESTMPMLGLDEIGLEEADRKYLVTGPRAIASGAGIDLATIEHVVEPALLLTGLIARTPRGRRITRKGYAHVQQFMTGAPSVNWKKVESADGAISSGTPDD